MTSLFLLILLAAQPVPGSLEQVKAEVNAEHLKDVQRKIVKSAGHTGAADELAREKAIEVCDRIAELVRANTS